MKQLFPCLFLVPLILAWILPSSAAHSYDNNLPPLQEASPTPETDTTPTPSPPTASEIIESVNQLRLTHGLPPLHVHPVLMQVAAQQASALAFSEGAVGHERPCGMTLGQQLLSMGYPLLGDLSMDGYRSENWAMGMDGTQVFAFWLSDDLHTNTMLSENRSDIGAAVVTNSSGQIFIVLETAWSTSSGRMQYDAIPILTGIPATMTVCAGFASGEISNYITPVSLSTARPDGDVMHEVKYGQNLWSIAELYKVSVDQIKRLNGLPDDTIVVGWKLLIQKGATQPPPVTDTPLATITSKTSTPTRYPTSAPYYSPTASTTATVPPVPVSEFAKQNSTVIAGLLIAFSVLAAAVVGFSKKRDV
jgi:uncharacterized protein YkwD/LysM repeat protein